MEPPPPPPLPPPPPSMPAPLHPPPHSSHRPSASVEDGGQSPETTQGDSTALIFSLNLVHNLTQLCLGGVVVSALIIPNILDIMFTTLMQHIILCTVGYFILMTQAIISLSPLGWANNLKYENKRIIHMTLQIIGSILAITGSAIQLANTNFNIESAHGICGFVAMILTIISLIGGLLNFIFPEKMSTKLMTILHSCAGTFTISVAFIALIFAFHFYYREVVGDTNANLYIAIASFALVGTLLIAFVKNIKRMIDK